jgi:hypothetical protein
MVGGLLSASSHSIKTCRGRGRTHGRDRRLSQLIGTERDVLIAGLAPDLPFYLTYPPWLIINGQFIGALRTNNWPETPAWMYQAHHIAHS